MNYTRTSVGEGARIELHDLLKLTGAEVTVNRMPAGASVPFVHAHKKNEEIYAVLSGKCRMMVDGEAVELAAGDWLRVAPDGKRQLFADTDVEYICIQVKAGSLEGYTMEDGYPC